jgi:hypothetical protein
MNYRGVARAGARSLPHQPRFRRHFRHAQFLEVTFERYLENIVRHCANPQTLQRAFSWHVSHKTAGVKMKTAMPSATGLDQSWAMMHPLA